MVAVCRGTCPRTFAAAERDVMKDWKHTLEGITERCEYGPEHMLFLEPGNVKFLDTLILCTETLTIGGYCDHECAHRIINGFMDYAVS